MAASLLAVVGHLGAEALASGKSLQAVALEPFHLYLLVLPVVLLPLWLPAARAKCIGLLMFAFVAGTLVAEGNGLAMGTLLIALLVAAAFSWLGALALESLSEQSESGAFAPLLHPSRALVARRAFVVSGPYFAYVSAHGNRPPPIPVASSSPTY
jgi:predicted outer membrane lipoprotein